MSPSVNFDDTANAFRYKSDRQLRKANLIFTIVNHPAISRLATEAVRLAMAWRLPVKGLIRSTVFEHFCGGKKNLYKQMSEAMESPSRSFITRTP